MRVQKIFKKMFGDSEKVTIFAAKFLIKKFVDMKDESKNYKEEIFEGEDFVRECLKSFDENVSAIEAEFANIQT